MLSGSKRSAQEVVDCLDCSAKGWRADPSAPPVVPQPIAAEVVPGPWIVPDAPPADDAPETDPWGTPPGAPYYGVMLQYRPDGADEEIAAWKAANGL